MTAHLDPPRCARDTGSLRSRLLPTLLVIVALGLATPFGQEGPDRDAGPRGTGPFAGVRWRFVGPPGNRVSAVVGVPGDPNVYYAGGASGGVWKSTDAGVHWRPVFDDQDAQSIGALAIAPSDHNIVWAGTGETFIRSNVSIGNGIYKSTDAGKTWVHMGLERTGRIGRVVVHPRNPDVVFAAALGHGYGPQQDRGVYRTLDGGKTWSRVLFVDEQTGAADLAMDPVNPDVLFAGMWQFDIKTWGRTSGGPGSGVFASRDGGATWTRIQGHGLPASPLGKIAVAVAPSRPARVYALIETGQRGSLWRSDDGGENWRRVNESRLLNERPHYYTRMLVMPDNANEVYFPSNGMGVSYDGGETAEQLRGWGGDNHDMWADPSQPDRMMIGNDLGVMISTVRGREWNAIRLPVGQIYHVATDDRIPYFVYGQMQDYAPVRGPSNSLAGAIHPSLWTTTAGCETGWNIPDPVQQDIVWGGCYAGVVERFDLRTRHARTVSVWPERTMGAPARDIKLRMNWTFPIAISPHDHETVYVGSQYVHRTTDGGATWTTISPDLTLNDPSMMGDSGGLTVDNLSVEYAGVVFAIAESPRERGVIWAGTNDGLVQLTRDGGRTWTNVTPNLPGLPPKMTVSSVEPSRHADGVCYVAIDGHQVDDRDPWIYRTTDYGRTWSRTVDGIPRSVFSYVHVVREDPKRRGLLYAGTENGVYVSFDDGASWSEIQNDLPRAPVHWLAVQDRFGDLVAGTYGRGIWILDDVTPLQQLTDTVRARPVHLFAPRDAWRFRAVERRDLAPAGTSAGRNPPYGASISYWVGERSKTSAGAGAGRQADAAADGAGGASIEIVDGSGSIVRSLKGPARPGVNRVWWDLRYEPTKEVELRTTPPGNPSVWSEKRFVGKATRGVSYYGIDTPKRGPLVAPGTYTVRLTLAGQALDQPLTVRKDPNTAATDADVMASTALALDIYRATNEVAGMINQLEWSREQLEDFRKTIVAGTGSKAGVGPVDALAAKALAIEDDLLQPTLAEGDLKSFRGPLKLYLSLLWLQAEVGTGGGDVAGNADFAPTASQREVFELLRSRLDAARRAFDELYATGIPGLEKELSALGVPRFPVVKPAEGPARQEPR